MIEAKSKEIDGMTFEFMPLMATPAREMLDKLINKLGPSVASALEGLSTAKEFSLEDDVVSKLLPAVSGSLGGGLRGFCEALQPSFHKELVDSFFKNVTVEDEGKKLPLKNQAEFIFATKLLTETKVLAWCLEVQYSDFFELLKQGLASATLSLTKKTQSNSDSQTKSIGLSTG